MKYFLDNLDRIGQLVSTLPPPRPSASHSVCVRPKQPATRPGDRGRRSGLAGLPPLCRGGGVHVLRGDGSLIPMGTGSFWLVNLQSLLREAWGGGSVRASSPRSPHRPRARGRFPPLFMMENSSSHSTKSRGTPAPSALTPPRPAEQTCPRARGSVGARRVSLEGRTAVWPSPRCHAAPESWRPPLSAANAQSPRGSHRLVASCVCCSSEQFEPVSPPGLDDAVAPCHLHTCKPVGSSLRLSCSFD